MIFLSYLSFYFKRIWSNSGNRYFMRIAIWKIYLNLSNIYIYISYLTRFLKHSTRTSDQRFKYYQKLCLLLNLACATRVIRKAIERNMVTNVLTVMLTWVRILSIKRNQLYLMTTCLLLLTASNKNAISILFLLIHIMSELKLIILKAKNCSQNLN